MSIRPIATVVVACSMVALGCAGKRSQPASAEGPQGLVIVRLVGQHQSVTVTSGPDGPLYTAQTSDGRTIVANASLTELRLSHPDVYRFVEPTVAADASVIPTATRGKPAGFTRGPSKDVLMLKSDE